MSGCCNSCKCNIMVLGKGLEEIEGIDFETTVTCE